jgi:hypothetical protein
MLKTNAPQLSARMLRRARQVNVDQQAASTAIAALMTQAGKENLGDDVYRVPVRPGSRQRTGRLYAAERWVAQGVSVVHVNTAPHALARYRYGRPGGRPAHPPYGIWRGPRFVLGTHLRQIQKIRIRHLRDALRVA